MNPGSGSGVQRLPLLRFSSAGTGIGAGLLRPDDFRSYLARMQSIHGNERNDVETMRRFLEADDGRVSNAHHAQGLSRSDALGSSRARIGGGARSDRHPSFRQLSKGPRSRK